MREAVEKVRKFIRDARRRPLISDWLPVEDYAKSGRALILTDGTVYASFEVEGRAGETANEDEHNQWHAEINGVLRNLCDDRLIIKTKVGRGHPEPGAWPQQECGIPFLDDLTRQYRDNLLDRRLYVNRLYLTLEYKPSSGVTRVAEVGPRREESQQERLDLLERACEQVKTSLAAYGLRRLGCVRRGRQMFDEMLEAEAFILTGVWRAIGVTRGRPGDVILSETVTFHHEHVEIRGPGHTVYAACLGFKDFPAMTYPGILNGLLAAPIRFSLVQSFRFMEQAEGQAVLTRKQNRMLDAQDKAYEQRKDLEKAANDLQAGSFVMGDYNLTLCVFAERAGRGFALYERLIASVRKASKAAALSATYIDVLDTAIQEVIGSPDSVPLSDAVNVAWRVLGTTGCTVIRESAALMGAWLCLGPGNDRYRPRPGAITSLNFAGFNPLLGYAAGPESSRWGAPVAVTVSPGGTAYRMHWHEGTTESASGGTLVTGKTGSGKTLGTGFFNAFTVARIWPQGGGWISIDYKRGWNALTLAIGGSYSVLGAGEAAFAPLKALPNTPRTREQMNELLRFCIRQGGWRDLTAEEDHRLALGIATVMQNDPEDRWVREIQAFLGDHPDGAGARLKKWCWGEELGWVIDAPRDKIDMSGDINGFDTTRLLANKRARGPAMLYLFYRIEQRLDGRPLLITVDEGWNAVAEEEITKPAIERLSRTIRSKNGVLVFITQSPADAVKAGMTAGLLEQFPNQHHYYNPAVSLDDWLKLGRTVGEYAALKKLQPGTGQFVMVKGDKSSLQATPLAGMDDAIAILSLSEANVEAIDAMSDDDRADPIRFQAEFHRRRHEIAARGRRTRQRTYEDSMS